MNNFFRSLIILCFFVLFCFISCDQENEDSASSSNGGSSNSGNNTTVAITGFTISPSGTINMIVDETKDFTITYEPANATVTNILDDLTYDMNLEFFYPISLEYIKLNSTSHSITITVRAKKAGNTTISASLKSNQNINGSLTFNISGDSSSSSSSSSEGGEGGQETVSVTTLHITANVSDVTIDNIIGAKVYWGFGNYNQRKVYDGVGSPISISKKKMDITKTDYKTAVIKFTVESDGLCDDFFGPYIQIQFIDSNNEGIGNLFEVYNEDEPYEEKTEHSIEVTIEGCYADQGLELATGG